MAPWQVACGAARVAMVPRAVRGLGAVAVLRASVIRSTVFWTAYGAAAFVLGLLLGISGVPMAFAAKHLKNPPRFTLI